MNILDQLASDTDKMLAGHAKLRESDIMGKCMTWLADVTFEWRNVMATAV